MKSPGTGSRVIDLNHVTTCDFRSSLCVRQIICRRRVVDCETLYILYSGWIRTYSRAGRRRGTRLVSLSRLTLQTTGPSSCLTSSQQVLKMFVCTRLGTCEASRFDSNSNRPSDSIRFESDWPIRKFSNRFARRKLSQTTQAINGT